jgi:hypothetical protein
VVVLSQNLSGEPEEEHRNFPLFWLRSVDELNDQLIVTCNGFWKKRFLLDLKLAPVSAYRDCPDTLILGQRVSPTPPEQTQKCCLLGMTPCVLVDSLLFNGYRGLFPRGVKRRGYAARQLHLVLRSRNVELYLCSPICLHGMVLN